MIPAIDIAGITRSKWERNNPRAAKSITVVAIANREVDGHEQAILRTVQCIPHPCSMLMISPTPPRSKDIKWLEDPDWGDGRKVAFSKLGEWTLKKLVNHITTDAVIIVQFDGHALHSEMWTDEFFDYDYIGAPWPLWLTLFMTGSMFHRVGGAGFSYRSRKFLETTARMDYNSDHYWMEDIYTSRYYHKAIEKAGCRFAPVEIALKWCIEYRLEDYPRWNFDDSFGWHGIDRRGFPHYELPHWKAFYRAVKRKFDTIKP